MITILVGNISCKILTTLPAHLSTGLDKLLSYTISGSYFILRHNPLGWDGRTHLFSKKTQAFPTGLLKKVLSYLREENGVAVEVKDMRVVPFPIGSKMEYTNILKDFQQEAVDKCLFLDQRGIIKSPTGSGKTMMMMTLVADINKPTIILVNKKDLLWQTRDKIKEYLNYDAGILGDGHCEVDKKINVCMIQTLCHLYNIKLDKKRKKNWEEEIEEEDLTKIRNEAEVKQMVETCQVLCVDEVHHLASRTMYNFQKHLTNAYYRFGFSATPYTMNNKDLLLESAIGPIIVDISLSDLISKGFISTPTFYWIKFNHRKYAYTKEEYRSLYKKAVVENEDRNSLIIDLALKAYAEDKRVLISVTSIEHGLRLEKMLKMVIKDQKEFFIRGSTPGEVRNNFKEALNKGDVKIAIATVVWGEGIDIPNLDLVINTKAQKSIVDFLQLIGRALRITATKKTCTIIDIYDYGCPYLMAHSKHRFECLENEKLIKHKFIKLK